MQLALLDGLPDRKPSRKSIALAHDLKIPEAIRTIDFTHGLHRFPGKFVPQIPQYIFKTYLNEKSRILDPFCGSGTTLVEAILTNRYCVGYDIDPLSILVVNGKTHPLSISGLLEVTKTLGQVVWKKACAELDSCRAEFRPLVFRRSYRATIRIEEGLFRTRWTKTSFRTRSAFLPLFDRVSNADDQTQKTYVSHTRKKTPPLPRELFSVMFRRGLERMAHFSRATPTPPRCEVRLHDSRTSFSPAQCLMMS